MLLLEILISTFEFFFFGGRFLKMRLKLQDIVTYCKEAVRAVKVLQRLKPH